MGKDLRYLDPDAGRVGTLGPAVGHQKAGQQQRGTVRRQAVPGLLLEAIAASYDLAGVARVASTEGWPFQRVSFNTQCLSHEAVPRSPARLLP
jgi:hypothetical protein